MLSYVIIAALALYMVFGAATALGVFDKKRPRGEKRSCKGQNPPSL